MPRAVLFLLILALATCRVVCAADACESAHPARVDGSTSDESPHPANTDNCLCSGGLSAEPTDGGLMLLHDGARVPSIDNAILEPQNADQERRPDGTNATSIARSHSESARERARTRAIRC